MKEYIRNYQSAFTIVLALIQSVVLGFYFAIYGSIFSQGTSFSTCFQACGKYNLLLIVIAVIIFFQIQLGLVSRQKEITQSETIINKMLMSACETLIYPELNHHIRACVTICNYKTGKRTTCYSYNLSADPERTAVMDINFGITGKAIERKAAVAEELPQNHMESYSLENGRYIAPEVKSVLAAPIFSQNDSSTVIGVVAFDSFEPLKDMHFDSHKSKEIAQMWADMISVLL